MTATAGRTAGCSRRRPARRRYNDATQATALATRGQRQRRPITRNMATTPTATAPSLRKRDGSMLQPIAYDALNRMTVKTVPEPRRPRRRPRRATSITATTCAACRLYARFDSPTGEGITNAYDGFGRLASTSDATWAGRRRTLTYHYDRNGNRTGITHPDGDLVRLHLRRAGPADLHLSSARRLARRSSQFAYDAARAAPRRCSAGRAAARSRPTAMTASSGSPASPTLYPGGARRRRPGTFAHNPAGQIATRSRANNDAYAWTGAYASTAPTRPTGSTSTAPAGAGDVHLRRQRQPHLATAPTTLHLRRREPAGRRRSTRSVDPALRPARPAVPGRRRRGGDDHGSSTTATRWSPNMTPPARCCAATSTAPAPTSRWSGYDGATASPTAASCSPTTRARSSPSPTRAAHVVAINTLRRIRHPRPRPTPGRFQYTGQIWLAELGMYHYKARIYSPTLGGSCRPIRSGMRIRSTSMPMSGMIRSITPIPTECRWSGTLANT